MAQPEPDTPSEGTSTLEQRFNELLVPSEARGYLTQLLEQRTHPRGGNSHVIGETFFPSALLSETERRQVMGVVDYQTNLANNADYLATARGTALVITDMDAGIGSTIDRLQYIESLPHVKDRGLGSKGSDIHFAPPGLHRPISVMEAKMHRYYHDAGLYGSLTIQPLIDHKVFEHFLQMQVPTVRARDGRHITYKEFLSDANRNITLTKDPIEQPDLPTIDNNSGLLTNEPKVPGGHGNLAYMLLQNLATNFP